MRRLAAVALALAAAACGPTGDPLAIYYTFSAGPEQVCEQVGSGDPVLSCDDVPVTCQSVALLRIVNPDDPDIVYSDQCVLLDLLAADRTLCSINRAGLDSDDTFPTSRVEVQLAVYKGTELEFTPEGEPICPPHIDFTATGFAAVTNDPKPALAGKAYTTGFDDSVTVVLGCSNTLSLNTAVCSNDDDIAVNATVYDFELHDSVSLEDATHLTVHEAEPTLVEDAWSIAQNDATMLMLATGMGTPVWGTNAIHDPMKYTCIQVQPQNGALTLTCAKLPDPLLPPLNLQGFLVRSDIRDTVLDAAGLDEVPMEGMVIGIVVNAASGEPLEGIEVTDLASSEIRYLSADGMTLGGAVTSSKGIFVALDAPFEAPVEESLPIANEWHAVGTPFQQVSLPIGGLVQDHLTVVVIELNLQTKPI